ncbi:MAG: hypothetical protein IIA61_00435 [Candidatus Marinimicrobia bacterium]|nr:hypothetical protein [Candidatus Neomarinimicrobiota bacterium]
MNIIKAIIVIWVILFLAGTFFGLARSPDYSKTKSIKKLIIDKHKLESGNLQKLHRKKEEDLVYLADQSYALDILKLGNPGEIIDLSYCLTFTAEDGTNYIYTPYNNEVHIVHSTDIKEYDLKGFSHDNLMQILSATGLGVTAIGLGAEAITTVKGKSRKIIVGTILLALSGFGSGYYLGYSDKEYDSSAEKFQKVLKDKTFWHSIWVKRHREQLITLFREYVQEKNLTNKSSGRKKTRR